MMGLVALGTVTLNQVSRAMDQVNGVQTPVQYWNGSNCAQCNLVGTDNCTTEVTNNPCMCTVPGQPNQFARIGSAPIQNCVQLYRP